MNFIPASMPSVMTNKQTSSKSVTFVTSPGNVSVGKQSVTPVKPA